MIFTKRYPYRFGDVDIAGIAYYPSYFHYFHCCFEDWWSEALGTPYPAVVRNEQFGLPAVHADVDWAAPLHYGDTPDVSLAIESIGQASVCFAYWMARSGEAHPTCRARIVTVATDLACMRKIEIPPRWRPEFERFRVAAGQIPSPRKRREDMA